MGHYFLDIQYKSDTTDAVYKMYDDFWLNSEDSYYTSMNQREKRQLRVNKANSVNPVEINLFWSAIIRNNLLFYSNKLSVYHGTFDKWFRTQKRKYIFFSEKIFRIVTALKSNPMP